MCRHAGAGRGGPRRRARRRRDLRPTRCGRSRAGHRRRRCSPPRPPSTTRRSASRSSAVSASRGRCRRTSTSCALGAVRRHRRRPGPGRGWSKRSASAGEPSAGEPVSAPEDTATRAAAVAASAPDRIVPADRLAYGIQLPVQSQSTLYADAWESGAGPEELAQVARAADEGGFLYVAVRDHTAIPARPGAGDGAHVVRHGRHARLVGGADHAGAAALAHLRRRAAPPVARREGVRHHRHAVGRARHRRGRRRARARGVHDARRRLRGSRGFARRVDRRDRRHAGRRISGAAGTSLAGQRPRDRPAARAASPAADLVGGRRDRAAARPGLRRRVVAADGAPQRPAGADRRAAPPPRAARPGAGIEIGVLVPSLYVGEPSWELPAGTRFGAPEELAERLRGSPPWACRTCRSSSPTGRRTSCATSCVPSAPTWPRCSPADSGPEAAGTESTRRASERRDAYPRRQADAATAASCAPSFIGRLAPCSMACRNPNTDSAFAGATWQPSAGPFRLPRSHAPETYG